MLTRLVPEEALIALGGLITTAAYQELQLSSLVASCRADDWDKWRGCSSSELLIELRRLTEDEKTLEVIAELHDLFESRNLLVHGLWGEAKASGTFVSFKPNRVTKKEPDAAPFTRVDFTLAQVRWIPEAMNQAVARLYAKLSPDDGSPRRYLSE